MPTRETSQLPCTKNAAEFEKMCQAVLCSIFKKDYPDKQESLLFDLDGRNGQDQEGIDICSAFPMGAKNGYITAQCKNYFHSDAKKLIRAADADINRIIRMEIHVTNIFIMTSMLRTHKVQNHYRRIIEQNRSKNPDYPDIHVMFWEDISEYILKSDELMNRFYKDFHPWKEKNIVICEDDHMSIYRKWKDVQMEAFHRADRKINELLPEKIRNSKTDDENPISEEFKISKIINSLMALGIPIEVCFEIAETTANDVYESLIIMPENERSYTTAKIRKSVSMAIQEINSPNYCKEDIEKWTNRYARRYGHNSQCLEVYYPSDPNRPKDKLNYDYIRGTFLDAVINKVIPGTNVEKEISPKARMAISEEILAFINQCDLYQINFDLMVSMIAEIATQPPHPWLVSDHLREKCLRYNADKVKENLNKLNLHCERNKPVPKSVLLEILHHSCALILGTHNYFFGVYDMSSVIRLREILYYFSCLKSNGTDENNIWDDAIERTKLSGLLTDLTISGIDPRKLYDFLGKIEYQVKSSPSCTCPEFIENVRQMAEYAKLIYNCSSRDELTAFLNGNWADFTRDQIVKNVQTIFWTMFPVTKRRDRIPANNHFGVRYLIPALRGYSAEYFKSTFLIIVGLDTDMDLGFLVNLADNRKLSECNTVILVTETQQQSYQLKNRIQEQMKLLKIDSVYRLITVTKKDLEEELQSGDKIKWFEDLYESQFDDEDFF